MQSKVVLRHGLAYGQGMQDWPAPLIPTAEMLNAALVALRAAGCRVSPSPDMLPNVVVDGIEMTAAGAVRLAREVKARRRLAS